MANNKNNNLNIINELSPALNGEEIVVIEGTIDNIRFYNEDNCYAIINVKTKEKERITIVGTMISPAPGSFVSITAKEQIDKVWGKQYRIITYEVKLPATVKGIEEYLGSGIIRGIGKKTAKLLVEHFGLDTLKVIEKKPQRLLEIHGIGAVKANEIVSRWHEQHEIRDIMIYLQGVGISTTFASKIYKKYGSLAVDIVSKNPYRLAKDIHGIAFNSADKIAAEIGIKRNSRDRIEAGIIYTLQTSLDNGNIFVEKKELASLAESILAQGRDGDETPPPEKEDVENVLEDMIRAMLITEDERIDDEISTIYLNQLYLQEKFIARRVNEIISSPKINQEIKDEKKQEYLEALCRISSVELAKEQIDAIETSLTEPIMILTGGPGTGKTTVTKAILSAHLNLERNVSLCSPTGRAAKRLSEISGFEATTIHRLLETDNFNSFKRNKSNPLECDTLIIDEVSMVDNYLAASILDALADGTQLILIGDADQLPSVGAGNLLSDLIKSEKIPIVRLTEIFRQAQSSNIITAAHSINNGTMPILKSTKEWRESDLLYIPIENELEIVDKIKQILQKSLPTLGFTFEDIQVLTPMQRSSLGAQNLNDALRETLNPKENSKTEFKYGLKTFRLGDRVMQTENDYDKEVFNGDIGYIKKIDTFEKEFIVDFQGMNKIYSFDEASSLQLAYALTIHKSQGSEYRAVVLVIHIQHYIMLNRQLIYTGLTRGKERVIIIGNDKGIKRAVGNSRPDDRNSMLWKRIKNGN